MAGTAQDPSPAQWLTKSLIDELLLPLSPEGFSDPTLPAGECIGNH